MAFFPQYYSSSLSIDKISPTCLMILTSSTSNHFCKRLIFHKLSSKIRSLTHIGCVSIELFVLSLKCILLPSAHIMSKILVVFPLPILFPNPLAMYPTLFIILPPPQCIVLGDLPSYIVSKPRVSVFSSEYFANKECEFSMLA